MAKRVLLVNVYFAPNSFGGATIVAEEMAQRLAEQHQWAVGGFTSMHAPALPNYVIRRYRARSTDVVAISLPSGLPYTELYRNAHVRNRFVEVLEAFAPDVVHFHSIQTLGADLLEAVRERKIPLAVTLHDSWWLCERQFMIDRHGQHCLQTTISPDRCRYCVGDHRASSIRSDYLREQLYSADALLFPSRFQRDHYLNNGAPAERCLVNKNGVMPPAAGYRRRSAAGAPVFGFIGGPGATKGGDLIVRALQLLGRKDVHLKVVDAAQNIGATWKSDAYWNVPGTVENVAAYKQDSIDAFFASIDVLLFPSQAKESFGLTVREALLRDVWVIATDAGGAAEDLRDGENATLIALDGEHRPLAEAIDACMNRRDWADYRNPHKSAITTLDDQAGQLSAILHNMVNPPAPGTQ